MDDRPVAVVTGGTRGIGAGIAEALAGAGYDLLLTYNTNLRATEAFVASLMAENKGLTCVVVGGDLYLPETRGGIFAALDSSFPGRTLGAVVHNAGLKVGVTSSNEPGLPKLEVQFGDGTLVGKDGTTNLEHVKYYQALYGDAFIDLCERALQRMTDGGSLVGISSPGCNVTQPPRPFYALPGSGKCVMEYAMRIFALSGAKKNVNCNVVIPGYTVSGAWDKIAEMRGVDTATMMEPLAEKRVPMRRSAPAREVGEVVAFLCGQKGRYITGVSLPVDGGLHLV